MAREELDDGDHEDLRYPWIQGAPADLPSRIMHRDAARVLEVASRAPPLRTVTRFGPCTGRTGTGV